MRGRKRLSFVLLLLSTFAAGPLYAGLIHVSMTAEISWTDLSGPFADAAGTVTAEATFADSGVESGSYYQFYDDAGYYEMTGAPNSIAFNLGEPGEFDWSGTDIGVFQQDYLSLEVSAGHSEPTDFDWFHITTQFNGEIYYMIFSGPAGSLGSDDIPDIDTLNNFWDSAGIWVTSSFSSEPFWIGATATDVTFTALAVPLPASLWLMLAGLSGLGSFARRRQSHL